MKRGKTEREEYIKKRKKYREWCNKRSKHEEKEEIKIRRIRRIKTQQEAWRYINTEKRQKRSTKM